MMRLEQPGRYLEEHLRLDIWRGHEVSWLTPDRLKLSRVGRTIFRPQVC